MYYIYRITNKVNGKTYIGQHKYKKLNDRYMGSGKLLAKAKKKYGKENFVKEILVFNVLRKEHADLLEITFIASERAKGKAEYNIAEGGQGGSPNKGKPHSEEWKKKLSDSLKGKKKPPRSEEHKGKPGNFKGKHHSEETRRKIAEGNKMKHVSEESKRKISAAKKGRHWKLVDGKRVWY